jgi:SAM-dependent methyltransferase
MRPCFICETGSNVEHFAKLEQGDYLRCSSCGLIYVDNVEPTTKLYRSYTGGAWKSWRRKLVAPFRGFSHVRHFTPSMERANRIFALASSLAGSRNHQPTLLDIGCNKGFLLAAAIAHSWNVYGVETVPELTVAFRRKFKQFAGQIFTTRFADVQARLEDNTFDVITAIDVIEHFEEPYSDMASIYRILKPGGFFVLQTPDGTARQAAALKERWGALKPLEHLHIFNQANLEIFAKKLGFAEIGFFDPFDIADGNLVAVAKK